MEHLWNELRARRAKVAVIGMGYVGLRLAVAFAEHLEVVGFDVNAAKIEAYKQGNDVTGDIGDDAVARSGVAFTADPAELDGVEVFVVAVPTPVGRGNVPDLEPVRSASRLVAAKLTPGAVVFYESTVYPGVTEEECLPLLERGSGLRCGADFKIGYSPERINPGDREHLLANIVKVVSGMDEETLEFAARLYGLVVEAGVHRAPSIKVAEAAKVVENAQRDMNIAFMNELAVLFDRMELDTRSVLAAAGTKWNFMPFSPGLVGGHCISVDPYYLTYRAAALGVPLRLINTAREVNEEMGGYAARQVIKRLARGGAALREARVAVLGFTYKPDCADTRNTKVQHLLLELAEYGIRPLVADPHADPAQVSAAYGVELVDPDALTELDAVILAVPHAAYLAHASSHYAGLLRQSGARVVADLKGALDKAELVRLDVDYWRL
ncbi:nucleotide sugar dehydrogenase [Paenibacillus sp. IB182496]|uniref:Nucleotide sugar dehydrogenase n=1 Tax=Paenibacillus sabuli TaxID=2772509 RepID=A0A927BRJ1_9BACL|nr:nucleotide sugar dehydrogenase [Paenibacillus sabuli]MBD2844375.1 nucleotide sugar dehydrogenase [Paenibacillus sabuli]